MTRLSVLLLLAVVASALTLVHSQYESRRLFMALEAENKEATRLEVEHDRLQVERREPAPRGGDVELEVRNAGAVEGAHTPLVPAF